MDKAVIEELQRRFDAAELQADRDTLQELIADGFLSIGPKGYVLDKTEWIERHVHSTYDQLEVSEVDVRLYDAVPPRARAGDLAARPAGARGAGAGPLPPPPRPPPLQPQAADPRGAAGHGHACPVSDLFGVRGRELLARLQLPEPWTGTLTPREALLHRIPYHEREEGVFMLDLA